MLLTNELLSIGFVLASNFTATVPVPESAVMKDQARIVTYAAGMTGAPLHLQMSDGKTGFAIDHGIVYLFKCPGSYFHLQDFGERAKFTGKAVMSKDQALELATRVVRSLTKTGDPIKDVKPEVRCGGPFQGNPIPFYEVTWPKTNAWGYETSTAVVEIDGRSGKIVSLDLWDPGFWDIPGESSISNRVFRPDPKPVQKTAKVKSWWPHPTTNQVSAAIPLWLAFCEKLGVSPGSRTNLNEIDWEKSWIYSDKEISTNGQVVQVWFTNATTFECVDGIVYRHTAEDACFAGFWDRKPAEEWKQFEGKVVKDWKVLAAELETTLVTKLGIPREALADLSPTAELNPLAIGSYGVNRLPVGWRNWPKNPGRNVWIGETHQAFSAEFDLSSGDLKLLSFHDPKLIRLLGSPKKQTQKDSSSEK
jgi:hypothetical protein